MVHVAKEKRKKWDKKSTVCPDNIRGYRVHNPGTRPIITSRDVIIIEKESNPEHLIQLQLQNADSVEEVERCLMIPNQDLANVHQSNIRVCQRPVKMTLKVF